MVLDSPDWSRVSSGSLRFLGELTAAVGGSATLTADIYPSDRSIFVVADSIGALPQSVQVLGRSSGVLMPQVNLGTNRFGYIETTGWVPVSAAVDPQWDITAFNGSGPSTLHVWVFASTDSAPVVNSGLPTGVQILGAQVLPTTGDLGSHLSTQSALQHVPAAATQALVTFPATVGSRWVLDSWYVKLLSRGTADIIVARAQDGASTFRNTRLQVTATAGSNDEVREGPGLGIVGATNTAMTVGTATAPAAGNFAIAMATAYLVTP